MWRGRGESGGEEEWEEDDARPWGGPRAGFRTPFKPSREDLHSISKVQAILQLLKFRVTISAEGGSRACFYTRERTRFPLPCGRQAGVREAREKGMREEGRAREQEGEKGRGGPRRE